MAAAAKKLCPYNYNSPIKRNTINEMVAFATANQDLDLEDSVISVPTLNFSELIRLAIAAIEIRPQISRRRLPYLIDRFMSCYPSSFGLAAILTDVKVSQIPNCLSFA